MSEQHSRIRAGRAVSVLATVALTGGLVAFTATPAQAAGLVVNSKADTATPGDGACTLREAITNANANADTTGGDCAAGSGADAITFDPALTGTIGLGSQLTVTDAAGLLLAGPGADVLTISGNGEVRLFAVGTDAIFEASGLRLADGVPISGGGGAVQNSGTTTLTEIVATGHISTRSGGAVDNRGTLTVNDSTFANNTAIFGGGAIRSGVGTSTSISGSTFTGNSAPNGGAVETFGATAVIASDFIDNSASAGGGAMYLDAPALTPLISESTFTGNSAGGEGGAIDLGISGGLVVAGSTFSGNSSGVRGGAIDASGALGVDASTFSGNAAPAGGAIGNDSGEALIIRNATFAANSATAGAATLHRPAGGGTVSGSIMTAAPDQLNCIAPVVDGGANIDSGSSCGFTAPAGAAWGSDVAALLGPLADNGGPTATLLPLPGSPALDAIDPGQLGCPTATPAVGDLATDQRGVIRPQGPKCDIGAVEVEVEPEPVVYTVSPFGKPVTNEPGTTRLTAGDTLPLRFSVTDDEGTRITDLTGVDVTLSVRLTQCGGSTPVVDLSFAAGSALWLRADGSYQVDFKTQKSWAGLCGTVTVSTPNDGERMANLQFTGGGRGRG
ncbi:MAG TPA: choice-of-anchor Q domain-containing protein [Agromyces sp.]